MNIDKLLNKTSSNTDTPKKVKIDDVLNTPSPSSSYNTDDDDRANKAELQEKLQRIKDGPLESGAKEVIEDHSEDLKAFTKTSNWESANRLAESQWAIKAYNKYHEGKARIEVWLSDLHLRSFYKATDEVTGKEIYEKKPSEPSYIESNGDRQEYTKSFRAAIGTQELVQMDSLKKYDPKDAPLAHDLHLPMHYSTNVARPDATVSQEDLTQVNISVSVTKPKSKDNQDNDPSNSGFGGSGSGFGGSGSAVGGSGVGGSGSGSGAGGQSQFRTYIDHFFVILGIILEAISDAITMII